MPDKRKNLIVVQFTMSSAFNDEALLANAEVLDSDILIINDGRDDGDLSLKTGDRIMYLKHENPLGIGAMMANAVQFARDLGYTRLVFVGGRIESSRRAAELMLNRLLSSDITTCSRFLHACVDAATNRVNALTGFALTDMYSPYIALNEKAMELLSIEEFDEKAYTQIFLQAAHYGLSVKELSEESIVSRENSPRISHVDQLLIFIESETILYPITKSIH
jgi:hypothetical protein